MKILITISRFDTLKTMIQASEELLKEWKSKLTLEEIQERIHTNGIILDSRNGDFKKFSK